MVPVGDPILASGSMVLDRQITPLLSSQRINGTLPSYNHVRNVNSIVSSDHGKIISNF